MDAGVLGAGGDLVASLTLSGRPVVQGIQIGLTTERRRVGSQNRTLEDDLLVVAPSSILGRGIPGKNVGSEMVRAMERQEVEPIQIVHPMSKAGMGQHSPHPMTTLVLEVEVSRSN